MSKRPREDTGASPNKRYAFEPFFCTREENGHLLSFTSGHHSSSPKGSRSAEGKESKDANPSRALGVKAPWIQAAEEPNKPLAAREFILKSGTLTLSIRKRGERNTQPLSNEPEEITTTLNKLSLNLCSEFTQLIEARLNTGDTPDTTTQSLELLGLLGEPPTEDPHVVLDTQFSSVSQTQSNTTTTTTTTNTPNSADLPSEEATRGRPSSRYEERESSPTPMSQLALPPPVYYTYWAPRDDSTPLNVPSLIKWIQSLPQTQQSMKVRWALASMDSATGTIKIPMKSNEELEALIEFDKANRERLPFVCLSYFYTNKGADVAGLSQGIHPTYCTPIAVTPIPSDATYSKLRTALDTLGRDRNWSEFTNFKKIPNTTAAQIQVWHPWKRDQIFRHPELTKPLARVTPVLPAPGKRDESAVILYNTKGNPTTTDVIINIISSLPPPHLTKPASIIQFYNLIDNIEEQKWFLGFSNAWTANKFIENKDWISTIPGDLGLQITMGQCKGPTDAPKKTEEKGRSAGRGQGRGRRGK